LKTPESLFQIKTGKNTNKNGNKNENEKRNENETKTETQTETKTNINKKLTPFSNKRGTNTKQMKNLLINIAIQKKRHDKP